MAGGSGAGQDLHPTGVGSPRNEAFPESGGGDGGGGSLQVLWSGRPLVDSLPPYVLMYV